MPCPPRAHAAPLWSGARTCQDSPSAAAPVPYKLEHLWFGLVCMLPLCNCPFLTFEVTVSFAVTENKNCKKIPVIVLWINYRDVYTSFTCHFEELFDSSPSLNGL